MGKSISHNSYPIFYAGKWVIHHDISGYYEVRHCHVSFRSWIKYQMWREGGVQAKYPTFCLVLYNYKIRCQLQGQWRVVLNTSNLDDNMSAKDMSVMVNTAVNNGDVASVKKKSKNLHALVKYPWYSAFLDQCLLLIQSNMLP